MGRWRHAQEDLRNRAGHSVYVVTTKYRIPRAFASGDVDEDILSSPGPSQIKGGGKETGLPFSI